MYKEYKSWLLCSVAVVAGLGAVSATEQIEQFSESHPKCMESKQLSAPPPPAAAAAWHKYKPRLFYSSQISNLGILPKAISIKME